MSALKLSLERLCEAQGVVYEAMQPTAQYNWPLLDRECGLNIWVKHENQTPTGAFKVRGGLFYLHQLMAQGDNIAGIIAATRGNHGQSIAYAAARHNVPATIVVPFGNSVEKNAAMEAFGAQLIEFGEDFDAAKDHAMDLAKSQELEPVPSFHADLVAGVATYGLELFENSPPLDKVYVPIGLGSGVCGVIAARDALALDTEIIGVNSEGADAYARSFAQKTPTPTNHATTFADGMATRIPDVDALDTILAGAKHVITVSDDQIANAIRLYYRCTHTIAEGAGAAALAAALSEKEDNVGKRIGVILSGQNIDTRWYAQILSGQTPQIS